MLTKIIKERGSKMKSLRTGEVADMIGVTNPTVREYVKKGWLNCVKTPTGRLLFDIEDVKTFQSKYMRPIGVENGYEL